MDSAYRKLLEKQGYRFIGGHSACKTCHYTSASIAGKGTCYKQKFYGIQSHRCVQMTVAANFCNMDCVFCWRKRNNSPFGKVDDPVELVDNAVKAQVKALSGFGGNPSASRQKFVESRQPLHFAISLNGENTAYPRLGEFIAELNRRGYTSFLVTNGQLPEVLAKIPPPTQLYVSVSAPNEQLFNAVGKPMYMDGWQRLLKSLDVLKRLREPKSSKQHRQPPMRIDPRSIARLGPVASPASAGLRNRLLPICGASRNSANGGMRNRAQPDLRLGKGKARTAIRLTLIKGLTMLPKHVEQFAAMIKRANPMFVECKSYMWIGTSKERLEKGNMASHSEVREFARLIGNSSGYKLIDEQEESRVVLMMQEDTPKRFLKVAGTRLQQHL